MDVKHISMDMAINNILAKIEQTREKAYAEGPLIYTVKTLNHSSYRLDNDERPVLRGCIIGQLFHEELYRLDKETIRQALQQILKHTNRFAISVSRRNALRLEREEYVIE